ncbi:hypothetical protein DPMN_023613, partial [Dreissena polymorpha]
MPNLDMVYCVQARASLTCKACASFIARASRELFIRLQWTRFDRIFCYVRINKGFPS